MPAGAIGRYSGIIFPGLDLLYSCFIVAAIVRVVLLTQKIAAEMGPALVFYPSLAALVAFVAWLVFFR